MSDVLEHAFLTRDATIKGRTLTLACVPWMEPAVVSDGGDPYPEQFERGAFRKVVRAPSRTLLQREHDPGAPIAQATALREDVAYLIGDWVIPSTDDGDALLEYLADDPPSGASLGFVPGNKPDDNPTIAGVVTRRYVRQLREVSIVANPAYKSAGVLALRSDRARQIAREREYWQWHTLRR